MREAATLMKMLVTGAGDPLAEQALLVTETEGNLAHIHRAIAELKSLCAEGEADVFEPINLDFLSNLEQLINGQPPSPSFHAKARR